MQTGTKTTMTRKVSSSEREVAVGGCMSPTCFEDRPFPLIQRNRGEELTIRVALV